MVPLSAKKRSALRSQAHRLNPIVIIGDKGLTDEVIAEVDRSLEAHELIKVRAATGEREARDAWLETLCERLAAHPVQQIGKIFVIFRENAKAGEEARGTSTGTSRRQSRTPAPRPASEPRRRRPRTSR